MKTLNFYFTVFTVLFLSSCTQKVANIKELYNSGEAFEIEFASWESFDQSALKEADVKTPGVRFFYSKKTNRVVASFDDGRIGKYDEVKYNKIHSDDVQVCLQNDDVRFVIMNNGKRYSLKMLGWHLLEWHDLAYFEDGKAVPVNSKTLKRTGRWGQLYFINCSRCFDWIINLGHRQKEKVGNHYPRHIACCHYRDGVILY
ncbi:MAG: hypothetical protein MJZ95_01910 [Paludibacteraceae bacterium]|nr:hypothetical protein [Paludibacteraceae bacterium]